MAPRTPRTPRTVSSELAGVSLALDRIEAMAWLIDNIHVGELLFLDPSGRERNNEPPTWWSIVEGTCGDIGYSLEQAAVENIGRAVQEIRESLRAIHPDEIEKAPRRTARRPRGIDLRAVDRGVAAEPA